MYLATKGVNEEYNAMCVTCGCDSTPQSDEVTNENVNNNKPYIIEHHYYHQGDVHHHYHYHGGDNMAKSNQHHSHEHEHEHEHQAIKHNPTDIDKTSRLIEIEQHVLAKNDHVAIHNAEHFKERNILALNLMSSPGSGKTTLLTETLNQIKSKTDCFVIEGDQQTSNDAKRISATGIPVIQVNTGKGCHLDAQMIHRALHELAPTNNSILFIENVGNLVCPASFNLGEKCKVVVISVTEGDDKPLKYPHMFVAADLMIINKTDLLPYVDFNIDTCITNATQINPNLTTICLSCTTGEGLSEWLSWLEMQQCA